MSEPINIPPSVLIGKDLSDRIAEHNARVERIWLTVGSRCTAANAKRAAYGEATLSELQRPRVRVGALPTTFSPSVLGDHS
jgi:hypothetical protein